MLGYCRACTVMLARSGKIAAIVAHRVDESTMVSCTVSNSLSAYPMQMQTIMSFDGSQLQMQNRGIQAIVSEMVGPGHTKADANTPEDAANKDEGYCILGCALQHRPYAVCRASNDHGPVCTEW